MGIKSFQAPQKQPEKKTGKPVIVADYMSRTLTTFKPDQSVLEVMEILIKNHISGGPVMNDKDELVGVISEGDCMKQISESRYYNMPMAASKVADFMTTDVDTIDVNMDLFDACSLFHNTKRRRFPVMKEGKLVGQLSQVDVLKAALELKAQNWHE